MNDTYDDVIAQASSLGEVLKIMNVITDGGLTRTLGQRRPDELLGQACVRLGFISEHTLDRALHLQARIRAAEGLAAITAILAEVSGHVDDFVSATTIPGE